MDNLELLKKKFHHALLSAFDRAKRELKYNPTYTIRLVSEYGGVGAAKRIVGSSDMSSGFVTLWEGGRLDLSIEAHVVKEEFAPLFTPEEIEAARQMLLAHGYKF